MVASLPMYDRPELRNAHDRYWRLIRDNFLKAGLPAPRELNRHGYGIDFWLSPMLSLSQTCGLPYRAKLHGKVGLVGTPDFGVDGCRRGYYRSAIVVRANDPRTELRDFLSGTLAYNSTDSQSGYAALVNDLADDGWPGATFQTGSHVRSAQSVSAVSADIALIDAVSWRLMEQYDPFVDQLRVLALTPPTPGLPYITAQRNDTGVAFAAIERAISELAEPDRRVLGIRDLVYIAPEEYLAIPTPDQAFS